MNQNKIDYYEDLILDAERRVGSYVMSNPSMNDKYINSQRAKIAEYQALIMAELDKEEDDESL